MKTREIREQLTGKVDPLIVRVLEAQNEEIKDLKRAQLALAEMIDRQTNILSDFAEVIGAFKKDVERIGSASDKTKRVQDPLVEVSSVPVDDNDA